MTPILPEKIYFKIGEVSEIIGVEPYVLRYWETEFDLLKPSKAPSKHRLYKKRRTLNFYSTSNACSTPKVSPSKAHARNSEKLRKKRKINSNCPSPIRNIKTP